MGYPGKYTYMFNVWRGEEVRVLLRGKVCGSSNSVLNKHLLCVCPALTQSKTFTLTTENIGLTILSSDRFFSSFWAKSYIVLLVWY